MANSATGEENSRAIEILQEALQTLQNDNNAGRQAGAERKSSLRSELRSLDFWRAIIAECIGSFFYVFMVCGAIGHHSNSLLLSTISVALATGFGAAALIYCFGAVSGSNAFFVLVNFSF
jgi:Major intrinsic protein